MPDPNIKFPKQEFIDGISAELIEQFKEHLDDKMKVDV
jgi:hypothetical protein